MLISVIVAAHNPDPDRLRATLTGLRGQTLSADRWETILVDNASDRWPGMADLAGCTPANLIVLHEAEPGLSAARRRGFSAAMGDLAVLVDDDNVLAPDYLAEVCALFARYPKVGVAGGRSLPSFAAEPPAWTREFFPLLALRDLGDYELISDGLQPHSAPRPRYPAFAPIGAGMALRRAAWTAWTTSAAAGRPLTDRRGEELSSGGDNDIVFCAMRAGWEAGYFPQLRLTHLIPPERLDGGYLARLNRSIQKSWIHVLGRHEACPWPPLTASGAVLRQWKAWLVHRPWRSAAAHIRWQGACGHFEGRIRSITPGNASP